MMTDVEKSREWFPFGHPKKLDPEEVYQYILGMPDPPSNGKTIP